MEFEIPQFLEPLFLRLNIQEYEEPWILAGGIFLITLVVVYLVRNVVAWRVANLAERTTSVWDDAAVDALRQTRAWFVLALAAFCGSLVLVTHEYWREILRAAMVMILLLQIALWGNVLISSAATRFIAVRSKSDPASAMTVSALSMIARLVLYVVLLLLALENLGVDVTALIAGLGIGGIAVALAVQNILGDLLASLSIVFDKPFVPGDFIIVGNQMGTVQHIGLKTTRVASLSGEELVFSNNDLLQSRVQNFKRMRERRVVFVLGVTYQTPRELLNQIPQVLREIVEAQENVRFDRAHFKGFGDFALTFETVYYVLSPDFNMYMDVQQSMNLAIHEAFERMGIEFAYPTQMLYVDLEKSGEGNGGTGNRGMEGIGE